MDNRQLSLESRLLQLRDEIKALEASALPPERLKGTLQKLCAERAALESELINLVVSPENNTRSEAWVGLREGLLATVQSLAETLRNAQNRKPAPTPAPKESLLTRAFAFLTQRTWTAWGGALLLVYVLLIAMAALGTGFNGLFGGPEHAKVFFETYAGNPFVGLLAGLLVTAIIQSSSVTTSVIVGLCVGGLPIHVAIPMVMGANIGTSVTNTLVSLGHIGHRREFRRAFAAATIHDFFNITAVCLFLPTEMAFHWLERLSGLISGALYGSHGFNMDAINVVAMATAPVESACHKLFLLIPNATAANVNISVVNGTIDAADDKSLGFNVMILNGTINGAVDIATYHGNSNWAAIIAYPGSAVDNAEILYNGGNESKAVTSTYYVNGDEYATVYASNGNIPVDFISLFMDVSGCDEDTAAFYSDADMRQPLGDVSKINSAIADLKTQSYADFDLQSVIDALSDSYFVGDYSDVYVAMDASFIAGTITVYQGMEIYIDGLSLTNLRDTDVNSSTYGMYILDVGTHTFSVQVQPGFTGTTQVTVNGTVVSGDSFEITGDMKEFQIVVSGNISQDTATGGSSDNGGLGLTDYLLIILVILIVVMAIMVAMRLMRS